MSKLRLALISAGLALMTVPCFAAVEFDMSAVATTLKNEITGNLTTILPIVGIIFAVSVGIPWVLRMIKKTTK